MISRDFAWYHLCEGLYAAAAKSDSDEDSSRRIHAKAKLRLMSMSDKELRELAKLTSSFLDRPVEVSYQETKRAIAQHRVTASEWINDLKIDWYPNSGENMPTRILIVGGEPPLVKGLVSALVRDGFSVAYVSDYPEFLLKVPDFKPDLVIVAEILPSKWGRRICSHLGVTLGVPVCLLGEVCSGKATLSTLEVESDSYLEKTVHLELVAGVRAVLRRHKEQRGDRKEKGDRFA